LYYNPGKEKDCPSSEYIVIEPLTFAEHLNLFYFEKEDRKHFRTDPKIEYFRDPKGDIYHFADFNSLYDGKKVRIDTITNKKEESQFFVTVHDYISNFSFIVDDSASIFRYGVNGKHLRLLSRKNHTGKLSNSKKNHCSGVDVFMMFHTCDQLYGAILTYTNEIVMLKCLQPGKMKYIDDESMKSCLVSVYGHLRTSPKYTAISIPLIPDLDGKYKVKEVSI